MVLEARDFDSVISEVDVVHLVPIEVRDEKQFGLAWPKKIYGVVPIATGCSWSWALNHDALHAHATELCGRMEWQHRKDFLTAILWQPSPTRVPEKGVFR